MKDRTYLKRYKVTSDDTKAMNSDDEGKRRMEDGS
jgi:hypothetical protein